MDIIAIDPGSEKSGFVEYRKNIFGRHIGDFGKISNKDLLCHVRSLPVLDVLVLESINPYSMGKTIRDTILWSGRLQEAHEKKGGKVVYLSRDDVRGNMCGMRGSRINDKAVKQALIDRFACGQRNHGKGTKKDPGFFYGFKSDVWQAFALAVTYRDYLSNEVKIKD